MLMGKLVFRLRMVLTRKAEVIHSPQSHKELACGRHHRTYIARLHSSHNMMILNWGYVNTLVSILQFYMFAINSFCVEII